MKNRIGIAFLLAALVVPAMAQSRTRFAGEINAWDYAYGVNPSVGGLVVDSPATSTAGVSATFTVAYGYTTSADGTVFNPIAQDQTKLTYVPITICDSNGCDTAFPTASSCTTPAILDSCTVTVTFTHAHGKGARISSGSGGAQEAALFATYATAGAVGGGSGLGGMVALSPQWFSWAGGHAAGITFITTAGSIGKSMAATYVLLDWSGTAGAVSYEAAAGSAYASTTHVIY